MHIIYEPLNDVNVKKASLKASTNKKRHELLQDSDIEKVYII